MARLVALLMVCNQMLLCMCPAIKVAVKLHKLKSADQHD